MSETAEGDGAVATEEGHSSLSASQLERIKRNREKARSIRQARLRSQPYDLNAVPSGGARPPPHHVSMGSRTEEKSRSWLSGVCSTSSVGRDTGGGFLLDEEDEEEREREGDTRTVEDDAPALPDEQMVCIECRKMFAESFLFSKFSFSVCDQCRDPKEKHSLITKTEAKQKYLLKDCDFGERGGEPLPFILKRNPHGSYRTDMYLYLATQVEARAHEVWGGRAGLEDERERKREAREKKREKKYIKEIQKLRKAVVRSSATQSRAHEHIFSGETYCPETDSWTKTCEDCGHTITYEKM